MDLDCFFFVYKLGILYRLGYLPGRSGWIAKAISLCVSVEMTGTVLTVTGPLSMMFGGRTGDVRGLYIGCQ